MEPFIGQIIMFGGNFAPRGWALCDGQLLAIDQHAALFSILGTRYGGDGRQTFGLPDLRGRSPLHAGSGPGLPVVKLGAKGGKASTALSPENLPPISLKCNAGEGGEDSPVTNFPARSTEDVKAWSKEGESNTAVVAGGKSTPFDNYQPYQAVNFIIALVGTYPSRN